MPHGVDEHVTVQVTPMFVGSLATVAVNWVVVPIRTVSGVGVTETEIPGVGVAETVIVAEADAEADASEVALTATVRLLLSGPGGAV